MTQTTDLQYSLWLCPPANSQVYSLLESNMNRLRKELFSDTPRFEAHITLSSGISLSSEEIPSFLDKITKKARNYTPKVQADIVSFGTQFYKRVYITCIRSKELLCLVRYVREMIDKSNADCWMANYDPHISLVYANYSRNERDVQSMVEEIKDANWLGGTLKLVDTRNHPQEWKVLGEQDITINEGM